jgi:hypothetical protein
MAYIIYERYTLQQSFLSGAFKWLDDNVGGYISRVECDPHLAQGAERFMLISNRLKAVISDFDFSNVHNMTNNRGDGWQTFMCLPKYQLEPQKCQFIVVVDDELMALQFKLSFQ